MGTYFFPVVTPTDWKHPLSQNDWWKEQHDGQLRDQTFWYIWELKHLRAADLIWDAYTTARSKFQADPDAYHNDPDLPFVDDLALTTIVFYHLAVALELALKGHLVQADPMIVEGKDIYTHNLEDLCSRIQMPLSSSQEYLVRQLRHLVEWHGRYPTPPLRRPKAWQRVLDAEGRNNMPGRIDPEDYQNVRDLITLAHRHAQSRLPAERGAGD